MSTPLAPDTEKEAPPFAPSIVEDMFKLLDKGVRAHQLYMHNNPTYLKALENVKRSFGPLWEQTDTLTITVTETQFTWSGVVVHASPEKSGDSIPWLLFKDGLREFTWTTGFEESELEKFMALLPRVRRATAAEDDLLTMLWEQDFTCMRYRYVELNDPSAPMDPAAEPGKWPAPLGRSHEPLSNAIDEARDEQSQEQTQEGGAAPSRQSGVVRMEDFDSTLYFLDANEIEYLRQETTREYDLDLRRLVLCALLDIFELQVDPLVRTEVANDLEALVLHLLSAGQFSSVAFLLREVGATMQRARELTPQDKDRFGRLADRLSHPDALAQMLQALEESATLPPKDDLAQLFGQLKPTALAVVLDSIDRTQNVGLRPLLEASAERLAQSNTGELVRLVKDAKPAVAREAIRRAGAMRTAAAVPSLGEVLGSGAERPLRAAAVTALTEIGTPGALSALETALNDEDRDIRIATIRALMARTHRPALAKVDALVKGKGVKDADRTERIALFELYGTICGDGGITFLDGLLNAKGGLFARKEDPELRACAALALGRIGSAASRAVLEKAVGEKEVIVKSAVSRALKGGAA
ncbi:MAG: HEAT repeat domain-containing protein [Gemmatimonadetes bacterium]|nr:HEAT repeat domain-containing protein [Gemmatimonadota bacterium]MBP7549176.1 HEAT repeat domain-containing protein [Gemmatimonadaceae bacterium]